MPLSVELWTAVFSGLTLVVFIVTAIAGVIQLHHLRSNTSLEGLMAVQRDWQQPHLQEWIQYVRRDLAEKLKDPAYREEYLHPPVDRTRHPELHVCDYYEQTGTYLKYGLIDRDAYLDIGCTTIVTLWSAVWPAVETIRTARGPSVYENFEYLAVISKQWIQKYPNGAYPANLPRWKATS